MAQLKIEIREAHLNVVLHARRFGENVGREELLDEIATPLVSLQPFSGNISAGPLWAHGCEAHFL